MKLHRFSIGGREFSTDDIQLDPVAWQRALSEAHVNRTPVLCLCTAAGVPMVVYHRDRFHLRRFPRDASTHAVGCRSHEILDDGHAEGDGVQSHDDGLAYQQSCFPVECVRIFEREQSSPASRRSGGNGRRAPSSSLREILQALWRRAGFCQWRHSFTHKEWGYVAHRCISAAERTIVNAQPMFPRLIVGRPPNEAPQLADANGSPARQIYFALGEVQMVKRTARDTLVRTSAGGTFWTANLEVIHAYERTAAVAAELADSRVVALMSVYHYRNWRVHEAAFQAVTRDWHPFTSALQGLLYSTLVNDDRQFSIPKASSGLAPWAILWDAVGVRAIVPAAGPAVETVYPPWQWDGTSLPRRHDAARGMAA